MVCPCCAPTTCPCPLNGPFGYAATASVSAWGLTASAGAAPGSCSTPNSDFEIIPNPNRVPEQQNFGNNLSAGVSALQGAMNATGGASESYVVPGASPFWQAEENYKQTSYSIIIRCATVNNRARWQISAEFFHSWNALFRVAATGERLYQQQTAVTKQLITTTLTEVCPSPCDFEVAITPDAVTVNGTQYNWTIAQDDRTCTEYNEQNPWPAGAPCNNLLYGPDPSVFNFSLKCLPGCPCRSGCGNPLP